jgi:ArsR family transcriptional regulator, lead/cadmium/zinc/bismuth-responsive transcriptional repressor
MEGCDPSIILIFYESMERRKGNAKQHYMHGGHPPRRTPPLPSLSQIEQAAGIFRALGDPERLRLLMRLAAGEACVSELAEEEGEKITTVSARLKLLSSARLVRRRRDAKHVFYALSDEHVLPLIRNAIDHAAEGRNAVSAEFGHEEEEESP